jgi:hypothetical protein
MAEEPRQFRAPELTDKAETFLYHVHDASWQHYQHLEQLRKDYLNIALTLNVGVATYLSTQGVAPSSLGPALCSLAFANTVFFFMTRIGNDALERNQAVWLDVMRYFSTFEYFSLKNFKYRRQGTGDSYTPNKRRLRNSSMSLLPYVALSLVYFGFGASLIPSDFAFSPANIRDGMYWTLPVAVTGIASVVVVIDFVRQSLVRKF